jgi:hypothetical protein
VEGRGHERSVKKLISAEMFLVEDAQILMCREVHFRRGQQKYKNDTQTKS